jgi:glycerol-3-phosphate dehydrogenase (NAD(P)+)
MEKASLTQVGIIGAGKLGGAIGRALTGVHVQVLYFDKDPKLSTTGSIEDIVRSCQVLLLCVPSWAVSDSLKHISKVSHPHEPRLVVALAKGVDPGFVTMDELLKKRLPNHYDFGVMYGPMIAEEIDRQRLAHGVMALSNSRWYSVLIDHFAAAHIYLEASGDMHGVSLCAVLKNIYAIGFGICDGLNLGLNAKGKLTVLVLAEMKRMLVDLKASAHTAEGVAGLGDILATGYNEESFNYRIGKSLAERIANEHIKSEGLVSLYELSRHVTMKHYPVVSAIDSIVFHYGEPSKLTDLLAN